MSSLTTGGGDRIRMRASADDAHGDGLPWEVAGAISFDDKLLFPSARYCLGP